MSEVEDDLNAAQEGVEEVPGFESLTPEQQKAVEALQADLRAARAAERLAVAEMEAMMTTVRDLDVRTSALDQRTTEQEQRLEAARQQLDQSHERLRKIHRARRLQNAGLMALTVLAGALLALGVAQVDWGRVWRWLSEAGAFVKLASLASLVGSGRSLYWLRQHRPRLYGWREIAVGVATCAAVLWTQDPSPVQAGLRLMAGVYLMVRGHDNRIAGYERLMARRSALPPGGDTLTRT